MIKYSFDDLKYLMGRLRNPQDGCPWDLKQTYQTIVPHTLEEVYEVIDAIENNDYEHLSEELGDLLFQVVFYAQIASEDNCFELEDVVHQLVSKLIYRHPHVFPEGTLQSRAGTQNISDDDVNDQWDTLKSKEKNTVVSQRILGNVPHAMPGLLRARKLQSKAAKVGFDWPDITSVLDKVDEEIEELKEAIEKGDQKAVENELGDVLFVLANIARHAGIDPEQAIRSTNKKFERRFSHVEDQVVRSEKSWASFDLTELDSFWNEAKVKEKSKDD
jgi:ATP diphosphatase